MRVSVRKALVLSPHTDDAVIGAGVLIHRLALQGTEIIYRAFTKCDDTLVGTKYQKGTIAKEDREACEKLGIKDIIHYDFENKNLQGSRQEILDILYKFRADGKLDLVIAPYVGDFHQDHQTVAHEALRASTRHPISVLQYPVIGTSKDFNPNLYVPVTEEEAQLKIEAISSYKSQFTIRNGWFNLDNFWADLRSNGVYINSKFAEAFILVKGTWFF